ncbi:hypothetical protein IQ270_10980 [Microcoleus sp. LEGE 07076]|uniref:hypothetical protein n=1 Tax=Microcoleus sp. LEGE 07076 TaxID=915322 RepID=UPI00187E2299|nr:hypothetical protein [Microcoleus sp. LEGE 07076]MBE9185224.1 hypothetical protein [Microcoleus sp. LEGE 07076]
MRQLRLDLVATYSVWGLALFPCADRQQGQLDRKSLRSVKLVFAQCWSSVTRSAQGACRPA